MSLPTAGFLGELNDGPQDMGLVGNVIPMFQVYKLRLREVPGVSASEFRVPPSSQYLLDTWGQWKLWLGS